jgi:hypothetical protein
MGVKKYVDVSKPNVRISHTDYEGGSVEIFEVAINKGLTSLTTHDNGYVETKLGVLPISTYNLITSNSSRVLLRNIKCSSCRTTIIMKHETIENREMPTCPVCKNNIYEKQVRRK